MSRQCLTVNWHDKTAWTVQFWVLSRKRAVKAHPWYEETGNSRLSLQTTETHSRPVSNNVLSFDTISLLLPLLKAWHIRGVRQQVGRRRGQTVSFQWRSQHIAVTAADQFCHPVTPTPRVAQRTAYCWMPTPEPSRNSQPTPHTQWRYWQGVGLAIYSSRVRVLAGHHCVVALGKLLTPVCLCHQAV